MVHQQEGLQKDLSAGETRIAKDMKAWDDLRAKLDQAKQALFAPSSVPSTSTTSSLVIPSIGLMIVSN